MHNCHISNNQIPKGMKLAMSEASCSQTNPIKETTMLSVFMKPDGSRALFFRLNNALHLTNPYCSNTYKMAGVYAIYKNDVCYYVGQSKNLPSRISTHLTGKYESADRVDVYFIGDENFGGFYERDSETRKAILENNEKWLITTLKPIENLLVTDWEIPCEKLSTDFDGVENTDELQPKATILCDEFSITVIHGSDGYDSVSFIDPRAISQFIDEAVSIRDYLESKNDQD